MSTAGSRERALCIATFVVCLALNLWYSHFGLHNNLLEGHEFRQVQTALVTRSMLTDGWKLDYAMPLFGPPWSAPMEFPLYQGVVAAAQRMTGLDLEPCGRLVSLGFFYAALPAAYLLLGFCGVISHRRWLFLAALLVSPVYLYYSRTFMIESTALALSAWFLFAYLKAVTDRRWHWVAIAAVCGSLAALAKVTTLIVFLTVAAAFTLVRLVAEWCDPADRRRRIVAGLSRSLAATVPAVAIGTAWVKYSDAVKVSNPLSAFLASGPMTGFNFGTVAQRGSLTFWDEILSLTSSTLLPGFDLAVVVIFGLLLARQQRWRLGLLLLGYLAGPLIFANLYFVHDYYSYTTGGFLVAALALAWCRMLDAPEIPSAGKWAIIALGLASQVYQYSHSYRLLQGVRPEPPAAAQAIADLTEPGDIVLMYGFEWNPIVPYYAGRKAIMVTDLMARDRAAVASVLARVPRGQIGALVVAGDFRRDEALLSALSHELDLTERPVLRSSDTEIRLARRLLPAAVRLLSASEIPGFTAALPEDPVVPHVKWERYIVERVEDRSMLTMMHPQPVEVVAAFGLSANTVDGRRVFNAHAPTEVIFSLASHPRRLQAHFGLLPEAYTGGHALKGVRFVAEIVDPKGRRTVLFERFLEPNRRAADRGDQPIDVAIPAGASGRLVLSTMPGPENDISFNWAYWSDVTIQ